MVQQQTFEHLIETMILACLTCSIIESNNEYELPFQLIIRPENWTVISYHFASTG